MDVILKVMSGSKQGAKVAIKKPEFLIGRSPECHLSASTTSISRKHCCIKRDGKKVTIADLGSRNGTKVNGEKISEETELTSGDEIAVGPLAFMVTITPGISSEKKPGVKSVAEAAERTADSAQATVEEEDISRWLLDGPAEDPVYAETQTIRMDDTNAVKAEQDLVEGNPALDDETIEVESLEELDDENKKKKGPGKLPPIPKEPSSKDSREAAAQALRNWNRRH